MNLSRQFSICAAAALALLVCGSAPSAAGASAVRTLAVEPSEVFFSTLDETPRTIFVRATFEDGTASFVTHDANTSYVSSNPQVASVSLDGRVHAVGLGKSLITVRYNGISTMIPVRVGVFQRSGDLNGDGVVDTKDVELLRPSLGAACNGPGDPRDLNGDGRIDAADLRILQKRAGQF